MYRLKRAVRIGLFGMILYGSIFCIYAASMLSAQDTEELKSKIAPLLDTYTKLDKTQKDNILNTVGTATGGLNAAVITAYVIFGTIGFVAFIYGKKTAAWRPMVIGLVLMVYPYFVSGTVLVYVIGILLSVLLYFWRE